MTEPRSADVIVVGGGIAGVTAAYHLASTHSVLLLEQEAELAYHTTSRSAAIFVEHEGGPVNHRLSTASRSFLESPPAEITAPLMEPRGTLVVGPAELESSMRDAVASAASVTPSIEFLAGSEITALCPVLRPERAAVGKWEPQSMSVDVMALHQLFFREARSNGLTAVRSARVEGLTRSGGSWVAHTPQGNFEAATVLNAAGAWGDVVGSLAGAQPVGLAPKRRTAFTTSISVSPDRWPFVYTDVEGGQCYFKPEAGNQLLCSLADEGASEPLDARPREIDIAMAIDNLNALTTLDIRSVKTSWAGLRTFAPDRNPVLGWDDSVDGFCWMVGQGGTGITTSPAAGSAIAAIVRNEPLPAPLLALGLTKEILGIRRP